jgi:hypothetical protein
MSYEVGSHIDLSYLNKKAEVVPTASKKSVQETASNLYEVGTQFVFNLTGQEAKAARRIQVVYA